MAKRVVAVSVKFTEEEWELMEEAFAMRSTLPVSKAVLCRVFDLERAREIVGDKHKPKPQK